MATFVGGGISTGGAAVVPARPMVSLVSGANGGTVFVSAFVASAVVASFRHPAMRKTVINRTWIAAIVKKAIRTLDFPFAESCSDPFGTRGFGVFDFSISLLLRVKFRLFMF